MADIEVWGDSHASSFFGVGAKNELAAEIDRTKHHLVANNAWPGSKQWEWKNGYQLLARAPYLIVSTGTNEAMGVHQGMWPLEFVHSLWKCFVDTALARSQTIIWVWPHNLGFMQHVPEVENLRTWLELNCNAGRVIDSGFHPTVDELSGDTIHYNSAGSARLAACAVSRVTERAAL